MHFAIMPELREWTSGHLFFFSSACQCIEQCDIFDSQLAKSSKVKPPTAYDPIQLPDLVSTRNGLQTRSHYPNSSLT